MSHVGEQGRAGPSCDSIILQSYQQIIAAHGKATYVSKSF